MDRKQLEKQPWSQEGLERVGHCPICGDLGITLLHDGLTDEVCFCAPARGLLCQRLATRAANLDLKPTSAIMAMDYSTYYIHEVRDNRTKGNFHGWSAVRAMITLNNRYKTEHQPVWMIGRWSTRLLSQKRKQSHVPATGIHGLPLVTGCGGGRFSETNDERKGGVHNYGRN